MFSCMFVCLFLHLNNVFETHWHSSVCSFNYFYIWIIGFRHAGARSLRLLSSRTLHGRFLFCFAFGFIRPAARQCNWTILNIHFIFFGKINWSYNDSPSYCGLIKVHPSLNIKYLSNIFTLELLIVFLKKMQLILLNFFLKNFEEKEKKFYLVGTKGRRQSMGFWPKETWLRPVILMHPNPIYFSY